MANDNIIHIGSEEAFDKLITGDVPVLVDFFQTGLVEKFPTLIVCCFVAIAALISFFSGVVLDTIKQKNRQDFEINLHNASNRFKDLKQK